jgi:hypothetical protein
VSSTAQISSTASAIPASATPAATLPPIDVEFQIDCGAIDTGKQPTCDSYLSTTRDLAYSQLRRLTGISLADCYTVVDYTIQPASDNIGGFTGENHITYSETYSVDTQLYDVHELFHAFSFCSGALDAHVFHGAMMNAVFFALDDLEYSQYPTEAYTNDEYQRIVAGIPALAESERFDLCRAALGDLVTLAHFQLGDEALTRLYHSTISPDPLTNPTDLANSIWQELAPQVETLVEALESETGSAVDLPDCGL